MGVRINPKHCGDWATISLRRSLDYKSHDSTIGSHPLPDQMGLGDGVSFGPFDQTYNSRSSPPAPRICRIILPPYLASTSASLIQADIPDVQTPWYPVPPTLLKLWGLPTIRSQLSEYSLAHFFLYYNIIINVHPYLVLSILSSHGCYSAYY